jgi:cysteine desulfurase
MIYLDNNATTYIDSEVASEMINIMGCPYNASAIHGFGRKARNYLEDARKQILKSLKVVELDDYQLIFTSSGSEANNQIIKSFEHDVIITSAIEHVSILKITTTSKKHHIINVDEEGVIKFDQLEEILANDSKKLVSIIVANNETGVIQDIKKIAKLAHQYGALVHSDMVQAYGKIPIDLVDLDLDAITISAHKIGGPVGVGVLIAKKHVNIKPMIIGGGQEKSLRAGTENIASIVGFANIAAKIDKILEKMKQVEALRDYIEKTIEPYAKIVSKSAKRLRNTSCIIMKGVKNETQVIDFDLNNIAVSAGSACSSGKISSSYVLKACGYDDDLASCAIRVSLGINNTKEDADSFIERWLHIYKKLGEKIS